MNVIKPEYLRVEACAEGGVEITYTNPDGKQSISSRSFIMGLPGLSQGPLYVEVTILHAEGEPIVGVGLARWDQKQLGFPGWYERSIGFHSDDALVYDSQEGGAYTTTKLCDGPLPIGDTLGCGLDPDSGHIFFTRNGQTLNEPAQFTRGSSIRDYVLCVGLGPHNCRVRLNFQAAAPPPKA